MSIANFIIAGTEKAGTTSVFSYLSQHPEVCASRRKETDFFRHPGRSLEAYARWFPEAPAPVVMEASPAYLGEADTVVPRMRAMLPHVKLLFILREPVERLLSSFRFHRSKLNLPESLTFHGYVRRCLHTATPARFAEGPDIDDWHLQVLPFGCYAGYLRHYFNAFPRENIRVMLYDDLRADPRRFMETLSEFLGIDRSFWRTADLAPANVTFFARNSLVHRLALRINDNLESLWRSNPRLKSTLLGAYRRVNGAGSGQEKVDPTDRALLEAYYAPHNRELEELLERPLPGNWVTSTAADRATGRRRTGSRAGPP